jgi:hypothetical protein
MPTPDAPTARFIAPTQIRCQPRMARSLRGSSLGKNARHARGRVTG